MKLRVGRFWSKRFYANSLYFVLKLTLSEIPEIVVSFQHCKLTPFRIPGSHKGLMVFQILWLFFSLSLCSIVFIYLLFPVSPNTSPPFSLISTDSLWPPLPWKKMLTEIILEMIYLWSSVRHWKQSLKYFPLCITLFLFPVFEHFLKFQSFFSLIYFSYFFLNEEYFYSTISYNYPRVFHIWNCVCYQDPAPYC